MIISFYIYTDKYIFDYLQGMLLLLLLGVLVCMVDVIDLVENISYGAKSLIR
jgi:hypothetical protein